MILVKNICVMKFVGIISIANPDNFYGFRS